MDTSIVYKHSPSTNIFYCYRRLRTPPILFTRVLCIHLFCLTMMAILHIACIHCFFLSGNAEEEHKEKLLWKNRWALNGIILFGQKSTCSEWRTNKGKKTIPYHNIWPYQDMGTAHPNGKILVDCFYCGRFFVLLLNKYPSQFSSICILKYESLLSFGTAPTSCKICIINKRIVISNPP